MADIPVFIDSDDTSSERRVSPSWTVAVLKQKMWPITGIPPDCQVLSLPGPNSNSGDEETLLSAFNLAPYATIVIADARPRAARPNYTDDSGVAKYELSADAYAAREDSVLAYKRRNKLGRFNPDAVAREEGALSDLRDAGYVPGARCRVEGDADRRGTLRYLGAVPQIPAGGLWVGIEYDEPVGKNDGSLDGVRYFECAHKHGGFLRPSKVQVGGFAQRSLEDELMDSDLDEV